MHHPGPPRFVAVGDAVELAPRDPDPEASYRWRVAAAPPDSTAAVGDAPVEHLTPDEAGTYVAELTAPDGVHELTIRAFPRDRRPEAPPESHGSASAASLAGEGAGDRPVSAREGDDMGERGRPRVQLRARVEDDAVVVRAAVRPHPSSPDDASDLDVEFLLDDRDDLSASAATVDGRELRLPRDALPPTARVHGVAIGDGGYSVPDSVRIERSEVGVETVRPYDPPAWAGEATIYEIYLRSFTEDGGSFDAVVERLDYLDELGVDALWLTPVLENDHAPHGYNITDFFSIAADLGGREDYERLVEAAHDRDMAVLFDFVANHSARTHPFFEDAAGNPDSDYRDWYEWQDETTPETYFEWEHIANFDFDTLAVRRHLLDAVAEWAPLVDGFRCDMAWAVPDGFWREVHDALKARDPEFLLLDETIPYIPDYQAGLFDVHFDSTTAFALREVGAGDRPASAILDAVDARTDIGFPDHAEFMLYCENHDETRYVVKCGAPAAKAAAGALFTLPGVPMVYAGQELGQRGRRDALAWDHAKPDLQAHYRRLIAARHEHAALEHGAPLERVSWDVVEGDADQVVAFARCAPASADAVVVVLNFGDDAARVALGPNTDPTDLVTGDDVAAGETRRVEHVAVLPTTRAALDAAEPR